MSASGDFGAAPDGVDLSKTQNTSIRNSVVSLMVISTIFVILRLIARTGKKETLAIDDLCVILGLIFAHGTAICSLVSLPYGGGKHLWVLTGEQFTIIWQILFAYVMIYACAVTFTKLSIILFYRRIFGMNIGLWFCTFLTITYWVVVIVTILASCQPLDYFWTQYTTVGATGHCIDVPQFFFANGIWAMLVDVCILVAPVPIIQKLQMPRSQKMVVHLILLLGSFVCVASIVRIETIHKVLTSTDLTWAMGQLFIWSCCEPYIGIVCACLPTLAPFFRRWWEVVHTRQTGSSNLSRTGNIPQSRYSVRLANKPADIKFRNDDEVELTNEITGPGMTRAKRNDVESGGSDEMTYHMSNIQVTKDITWTSAHSEEHSPI